MEITFSLSELVPVAKRLMDLKPPKVILFDGPMGAGKTTLIKALCAEMGVQGPTSSPTFALVNEYHGANGKIYHFDLHRLKTEEEALDFGIEEYFYSGNFCFVEWPEKIPSLIPDNHWRIAITPIAPDQRKLIVSTKP
jgi:tRNA threonylcarbamoyladenosine biosynthesis protein TsaE